VAKEMQQATLSPKARKMTLMDGDRAKARFRADRAAETLPHAIEGASGAARLRKVGPIERAIRSRT